MTARFERAGENGRLTVAVPSKGRMLQPTLDLCAAAGLSFETTERALLVPCLNAPVDLLLVRPHDIPEYVQDGVVDCGITGLDLVRERDARVKELLALGFGSCRLEAAVPEESPVRSTAELEGASVATVYPRLTRELLPAPVSLVDVTGSVELAPRLGLADAIVDLVSSGNTLRTNGLRSLGVLLESQAVLVAGDAERAAGLAGMLRAVVDARRHRYLMLNAPESSLPEICALVEPRAPSVLPLAEPGSVAIHVLVPADELWLLLPKLEAAGGSSILIVPVERMAA